MKVTKHHVTYDAVLREVGIIFESENSASIQVRMSLAQSQVLGRDLNQVLMPTDERDQDPPFRTADSPK